MRLLTRKERNINELNSKVDKVNALFTTLLFILFIFLVLINIVLYSM